MPDGGERCYPVCLVLRVFALQRQILGRLDMAVPTENGGSGIDGYHTRLAPSTQGCAEELKR